MKIAFCLSQIKDGKYSDEWQRFISEHCPSADTFLHYYRNRKPALDAKYVIDTDLTMRSGLHSMMCVNHLKTRQELENLLPYDYCFFANIDVPVPSVYTDYYEQGIKDICIQMDFTEHNRHPGDPLLTPIDFFYGGAREMTIAMSAYKFVKWIKNKYTTPEEQFFCFLQASLLSLRDIRCTE